MMMELMTYIEYVEDMVNGGRGERWDFYESLRELGVFENHLEKHYANKMKEAYKKSLLKDIYSYREFIEDYVFSERDEEFFKSLFKENDKNALIKEYALKKKDDFYDGYADYCNNYAEKLKDEDKFSRDCRVFDEREWTIKKDV